MPLSRATTPGASSRTSRRTSVPAPPDRRRPRPPPNTLLPRCVNSASMFVSRRRAFLIGSEERKGPSLSSIPARPRKPPRGSFSPLSAAAPRLRAEGLTADVVVVHSFDELGALGREKVAGKIVLFNVVYDERKALAGYAFEAYGEAVGYRGRGAKAAADLGAVASLIRSVGGADYRLPHTGYSFPAGIPAAALAAEDADLVEHLAAQGRVRMHLTLTPQRLPDSTGYNVVADLKGSEHPEQIVVVSGHLDSWDLGRGAIDDGAGVVISMAAAQLLQQLHLRPRRTLRVIAWMDEENGGGGHQAYAKAHAAEMTNHVAAIESDAGAGHPLGFVLRMAPAAVASLQPLLDVLRPIGATVFRSADYSPGSDIEPLVEAGVPGIGIIQDGRKYFDYHHTAADTLDKVDPQDLRENAAAMAVMGYALAAMAESAAAGRSKSKVRSQIEEVKR